MTPSPGYRPRPGVKLTICILIEAEPGLVYEVSRYMFLFGVIINHVSLNFPFKNLTWAYFEQSTHALHPRAVN